MYVATHTDFSGVVHRVLVAFPLMPIVLPVVKKLELHNVAAFHKVKVKVTTQEWHT